MSKTIKTVQINSGNAEMVIYQENINLAIKNGWESLYFANNKDDFAWISDGKNIIVLTTRGEVNIFHGDTVLNNENENEIRNLLNSGIDFYEVDALQNNNWFSIEMGEVINHEKYSIIDEYHFESTPKSVEELEDLLIKILNMHLIEGVVTSRNCNN